MTIFLTIKFIDGSGRVIEEAPISGAALQEITERCRRLFRLPQPRTQNNQLYGSYVLIDQWGTELHRWTLDDEIRQQAVNAELRQPEGDNA